jgi:hypothetical protein
VGEEQDRLKEENSSENLHRLEKEIEQSRERLSGLVGELDHRRHEILSVRAHPVRSGAVGVAVAGLLAAGVLLVLRRRARRRMAPVKGRQIRQAFARLVQHPERLASDGKSPWSRILVAVAPILIKKIADRALAPPSRR